MLKILVPYVDPGVLIVISLAKRGDSDEFLNRMMDCNRYGETAMN